MLVVELFIFVFHFKKLKSLIGTSITGVLTHLEVKRLALLAHSLLSSAQGAEVLGGLRHDVGIQLN